MNKRPFFIIAASLGLTALASAASAHDFFLMPTQFISATGQSRIAATVSSEFPKTNAVVPADRVEQLYASGPGSPKLTVEGVTADALNLRLAAPRNGLIVAAMRTKPRDVDYAEDRIGTILEEYNVGPEAVAAIGKLAKPRTLQVSSRRFAKTIVCAVKCSGRSVANRPFGVALEFVGVGASADHFRLLSSGRPLPDHPVDLVTQDGERNHIRTDARGEVHLPRATRGTVMLFAAVMHLPTAGQRFTLDLSSLTLAAR